jgi:hypothetical protein
MRLGTPTSIYSFSSLSLAWLKRSRSGNLKHVTWENAHSWKIFISSMHKVRVLILPLHEMHGESVTFSSNFNVFLPKVLFFIVEFNNALCEGMH